MPKPPHSIIDITRSIRNLESIAEFTAIFFQGAATGVITGHLITLWITFGSLTVDKPTKILPLTIDGCTNETFSPHITAPESITPWTLPPNTYFDYGNDTDVPGSDNIDTILATQS